MIQRHYSDSWQHHEILKLSKLIGKLLKFRVEQFKYRYYLQLLCFFMPKRSKAVAVLKAAQHLLNNSFKSIINTKLLEYLKTWFDLLTFFLFGVLRNCICTCCSSIYQFRTITFCRITIIKKI